MTEICELCQKTFATRQGKKYHITVCHSKTRIIPWNKGKSTGYTPWNKGLTAVIDNRIKTASIITANKIRGRKNPNCSHAQTEETKTRIAKGMRGNKNARNRGDRQYFYNGIRMDSTWEVKVAQYLEENHIRYRYGNVTFPIDDKHSYTPDFVLDDGLIIEVKGFWRKENLAKFNKWKSIYPNEKYEIWDKYMMTKLNLI